MRDLETALKAAGDPTRTRILKLLEKSPLCVCQIQAVLDLAPSTISKHLALLKAAGLVVDRRDGKWVEYALAERSDNPYARPLLDLLRGPPGPGRRDPRGPDPLAPGPGRASRNALPDLAPGAPP